MITIFIFTLLATALCSSPASDLEASIRALRDERHLKGVQVQVSKWKQTVFNINLGEKNEAQEPVDNNTMFRVASLSKSFSSVALLQLLPKAGLGLNQSLSSILGYQLVNPHFPESQITVEMILSHQSSLVECEPYYTNFLMATYNAKIGSEVPHIKQLLVPGGQFYNECMFSKAHAPGTYFQYVNVNFGLAGTLVQILSGQRFDEYQRDHILTPLCQGMQETATFNPATIRNGKNLGVLYQGKDGKWVPVYDNYPSGVIPARNLTGYKLGTNGAIYGPQGGLRASASHLTQYALTLANKGTTPSGKQILTPQMTAELTRPRYQYNGLGHGTANNFHLYSLGLYTTSYRFNDQLIPHEAVTGHLGSAYNLISAQHYWGNYTLTYIISGALNGYKYGTGTVYEYERLAIAAAVEKYIATQQTQKYEIALTRQTF